MDSTTQPNLEDYSASSTITTFPKPLPLLRTPVRSNPSDGPHVLAFPSPKSWLASRASSRASLLRQCQAGAQIGCAIAASRNCKPQWWRSLLGHEIDGPEEREACEQRETEICAVESRERCVGFAEDKCLGAFGDARIAAGEERVTPGEAARLICWASMPEKSFGLGSDSIGNLSEEVCVRVLKDRGLGGTSYRGRDLMGPDGNIEVVLD